MSEFIKLHNIATIINVDIALVVDFLNKQGFDIPSDPDYMLSPELHALVLRYSFSTYFSSKDLKSRNLSSKIGLNQDKDNTDVKSVKFDWDAIGRPGKSAIQLADDRRKTAEFLRKFSLDLSTDMIKGVILEINTEKVIVDIGYESYFAAEEIQGNPEFKVGDLIDVYVRHVEGLHRNRAPLSYTDFLSELECFTQEKCMIDAYENQVIVSGEIIAKTKNGYNVEIFKRTAFLHNSQIELPAIDYNKVVGRTLDFKIIKMSEGVGSTIYISNKVVSMDVYDEDDIKQAFNSTKSHNKSYGEEQYDRYLNIYNESDNECPACGARGEGCCCNYQLDQF